MNEKPFQCSFCEKEFVTETRYLKHRCEMMDRYDEIKTPLGQAAFNSYQLWFKVKKKKSPPIDTFIKSKHYKPFIAFTNFIHRLKITEVELFIKMMEEKGIMPSHWARDDMYSYYIEYLDRKIPPKTQAAITLKTMEKIVDAADCPIGDVFDVITSSELIQLVRERKMSPWVILKSRKFNVKFELMTEEERKMFLDLVRIDYWKTKFQSRTDINQYMKSLVEEMDL